MPSILYREVQFSKALSPMTVRLLMPSISYREVQFSKALRPMDVTVLQSSELPMSHPENAKSLIVVTLLKGS